jgi:hypothetical protein
LDIASPQPANSPSTSTPVHRYGLFVAEGEPRRFLWKLRDEGIALAPEGLEWFVDGAPRMRAYRDIESVHLVMSHIPRSGQVFQATVRFHAGEPVTIYSMSASGLPDATREQPYRDFIQRLHARLSGPEFAAVRFNAGASAGKALGMKITLGVAAAFFVALPLVLLFVVPSFYVLGILLAGGALVWPLWNAMKANEPRSYSARDLPHELLP